MINVVRASIDDLSELATLFDKYRQFYQQPADLKRSQQFIKSRLQAEDSIIFMAKRVENERNTAIGFTQLYPTFSSISAQRSLILNDLFVAPAYRKMGAARQLMDAAKDYGKSINAKSLSLQTAVDNRQAQRLYESLGYQREMNFFSYYLSL